MVYSYLSGLRHYLLSHRCRKSRRRTNVSPRTSHASRFTLESLEPRVLLSATPVGVDAELSVVSCQVTSDPALSTQHSALGEANTRHELVFIDAMVQDQEQLLSGLAPDSDIVWLDSIRDGLEQISAALAGRHDLDAIHILSHGTDRAVKLGATWLTQETLATSAEQIAGWHDALADGADLLFYSCDLAGRATGQSLLDSFHWLTGADVAASTNDTGHAQFGADWTLEFQLGAIETDALISQSVQDNWVGLLDPFTVTTTVDSGGGSLRQAILDANALTGLDTISFNISGAGVHTITPLSALPTITGPVIIDGYTQPGSSPNALTIGDNSIHLIEIDGGGANVGLVLSGSTSVIRGLVFNHFSNVALTISGGGGNIIEGNFIGINVAGTAAANNGNGLISIVSSAGNLIGGAPPAARNVISGGLNAGIAIQVAGSTGNIVQGNYVGTNAAGTAALGNGGGGVVILNGATDNFVGGAAPGAGNLISGNFTNGVWLVHSTTTGNIVQGNLIGTNATGTGAIANTQTGVKIDNASNSQIGGTAPGAGNVISGNTSQGILIQNAGATGNFVQGNLIGTNAAGTAALGNGGSGIEFDLGASANTIGGTMAGARNIVSGNNAGIVILRGGTTGNVIQGNYIGTNAAGTAALGNATGAGVVIQIGAAGNLIGGLTTTPGAGAGNVIAGNLNGGVILNSGAGNDTVIQGNLIGLGADGLTPLANGFAGIFIGSGVNTQVGGDVAGARNVVSGNTTDGIRIGASGGVIQGNYIGMNAAGTAAVPNGGFGVWIDSAANATIGGTAAGAGNVISGNLNNGILIQGATGTLVQGNLIGTNAAGTAAVANARSGVALSGGATNNTIGGITTGARNVISGNGTNGIELGSVGTTGNLVQGNFIGTNATGTSALANGADGVLILSGASNNTIGGTTVAARNIISGNASIGVLIQGMGTTNNIVEGNYIGVNAAGTGPVGNGVYGVRIVSGANNNTIGGTDGTTPGGPSTGASNVISANGTAGIDIRTTGNLVAGNYIGTNAAGTSALANGLGIAVFNPNNTIGGPTVAHRNVIAGNSGIGVMVNAVSSTSADGNIIQGNYIGVAADGSTVLGNSGVDSVGIRVQSSSVVGATANNTQILGNVISGNAGTGPNSRVGILVDDGANGSNMPTGTLIKGNFIGTNATGTAALTGQLIGVKLSDTANSVIGGLTVAERNVISGNAGNGIEITGNGSTGNLVQGNYIGTNAAGTAAIANLSNGIVIQSGASGNTIGGLTTAPGTGAGNIISGNGSDAILISSVLDNTTVIQGNLIGLAADGTTALGNARWGVGMLNGGARIGGTDSQARNVISANQTGIIVSNSGSNDGVVIEGNYIGTDITGNLDRGNSSEGINVGSAPGTFIGGAAAGAGNVISGNNGTGIYLVGISHPAIDGLYNVAVQGNLIGLNAAGTAAVANGDGIRITNANNRIGGTTAGARNVISGNTLSGVSIDSVNGNFVQGNYIGVDVTGTADLGNTFGVHILGGASNNTIGGTIAGAGNLISGNATGIEIHGGANGNLVQGNTIGLDVTGTLDVGNGTGVVIHNTGGAATNNTIGGITAAARNVISGGGDGIVILGAGTSGNQVRGNYIGTNASGTVAVGIGAWGVLITTNASNNVIGGTVAGAGNVLSGKSQAGVAMSNGASGNLVQGNLIGLNAAGTGAIGNSVGVVVQLSATLNIVGGTTAEVRNVISGNTTDGMRITDAGTSGNQVQGNYIGTDAAGTAAIANLSNGILVQGGAGNNTIGGTVAGSGNTIAFNAQDGVAVIGASPGNRIQGNSIYSNGQLGIDLGANGVTANDPGDSLQNFPVLTHAAPGSAVLTGTLSSESLTTYTIEFFSNPSGSGDPTGFGEGRIFLGRTAVITNTSGNASFSVTLPASVAVGDLVTATTTDPSGNTSEFSQVMTVSNSIVTSAVLTVTTNGAGTGRITSLPLGIDTTVPVTGFTESYPRNTVVTLTATPTDPDGAGPLQPSTFGGWSGAGLSSTNPTLTLTMDQARTVTATFNPAGSTAPPPPVVDFVEGTSIFARSLTITWTAPAVAPQGYLVRVGTQDGLYDPVPYFVPGTKTSLTLTKLPGAQHYFTVSAVYASGTLPLEAGLESLAVPTAVPDEYYVPRGVSFQTVGATGLLANDSDPDGDALTAQLVAQPTTGGTITLTTDGSFLFTPNPVFTGSTITFQYRVSDDGGATFQLTPITVTINIAQESGQSQQAATTPLSGLEGWTVLDQGTVLGPSNWAGQDPSYSQVSGIDTPGTAVAQLGTLLYSTDGLAQGRTDYRLTMNLTSTTNGALGVTFRYVDQQNHYRFSMERDPNGDGNTTDGYRRLIKMVNGTPTVLREQSAVNPGLPTGSWELLSGPAYTSSVVYPLEITAQTQPITNDALLGVVLRHPSTGAALVNWSVTDPVAATPFTNNGLALYSAGNPGSGYDLLGIASLETPSQVPLEVRTTGTGVGVIEGTLALLPPAPPLIVLRSPGSPVASFTANTVVTLTATPGSSSTFAGWTGTGITGTDPNPTIQVTMNQAKIITAQFGGTAPQVANLDVDASGSAVALEDGIMITRYLFGVRGPALTAGAVNPIGARTNPTDIASYLDSIKNSLLDVDASGSAVALEDGIMITRYLFGVRGSALTAGAVNPSGQQTGSAVIADFLSLYDLNPLTNPVTTASSQLSAVSAQHSGSSEPSAINALNNSTRNTEPSALPGAIAATQLSSASVRSAPWVAGFLSDHQEDDDLVVMLA